MAPTLGQVGFSPRAAGSMAAMTAAVLPPDFEVPASPAHGTTTLEAYIGQLVGR